MLSLPRVYNFCGDRERPFIMRLGFPNTGLSCPLFAMCLYPVFIVIGLCDYIYVRFPTWVGHREFRVRNVLGIIASRGGCSLRRIDVHWVPCFMVPATCRDCTFGARGSALVKMSVLK